MSQDYRGADWTAALVVPACDQQPAFPSFSTKTPRRLQVLPLDSSNTMSDDAEYDRAQEALSTLISGRQRADGKNWAHAFDMMKVYLEASWGSISTATGLSV